jgi:hypothetical protein
MSQESFDQRPTTPVDCMLLTMSKTAAAAEVGGLWPLSLREITELILLAKSGRHHIGPGHVRCGRVALRHPASFVRS